MSQSLSPDKDFARRRRNALGVSWIMSIAATIFGTISTFQILPVETWLEALTIFENVLVAGSAIASIFLIRKGKIGPGMGLIIASILITILISPFTGAGAGVAVGLIGLLITLGIASLTLPSQQGAIAIGASIVIGISVVLLDLYGPENRPDIQNVETTLVIGAIVIVIFLISLARQFGNYSLRTKLIIVFLLVTLLPITFLGYQNIESNREALVDTANQTLLAGAKQTAASLNTFIQNGLDQARTQAQLPVFVDYLSLPTASRQGSELENQVVETLRSLSRRDPIYISSYALLDRTGVDLVDTYTLDIGLNKSDRDYFRIPFETGLPYMSPVRYSQTVTEELAFYFSAPVRDVQGEIIGVLRFRYKASILQQILAKSAESAAEGTFAILLDEHYFRLAHSANPELIYKSVVPLDETLFRELQTDGRMPFQGTPEELSTNLPEFASGLDALDTQPFFSANLNVLSPEVDEVAASRIQNQGWIVVFAQAESVFLRPIDDQTRTTLVFGLTIAAFVTGAAILFAQFLAAPLVRLTQTAASVSTGDLQARARVESTDEIGTLASVFNQMTEQLGSLIETLEQRVTDRTRALATSTEVSRRLSTILDPDQLVSEVVEQVQQAFNYYHAHIYLFDPDQADLIMVGGTGEAGRTMLKNHHSIPAGRGLVGRAAESNQVVLVPETTTDPNWLPNPLLPETKSEVAVPIAIGDNVLGVLDVQQNITGGLSHADADLLQSIANQVAIALQNAQTFEVTRKKAENEAIVNVLAQEIQRATQVEEVMQILANGLGRSLKVKRAVAQVQNTVVANGQQGRGE